MALMGSSLKTWSSFGVVNGWCEGCRFPSSYSKKGKSSIQTNEYVSSAVGLKLIIKT